MMVLQNVIIFLFTLTTFGVICINDSPQEQCSKLLPECPSEYLQVDIQPVTSDNADCMSTNRTKRSYLQIVLVDDDDEPVPKIRVCYDYDKCSAIWSYHRLTPNSNQCCPSSINRDGYYITTYAEPTVDVLYEPYSIWDRGLLTPIEYFDTTIERLLPLNHVNTAPRNSVLGEGRWKELETSIKNAVQIYGSSKFRDGLDIYTGTAYLASESVAYLGKYNGRDIVPVPYFFWKIVREPLTNTGFAVIGINEINSFCTYSTRTNDPIGQFTGREVNSTVKSGLGWFCQKDLCRQLNVFSTYNTDISDSLVYCCDVNEFLTNLAAEYRPPVGTVDGLLQLHDLHINKLICDRPTE